MANKAENSTLLGRAEGVKNYFVGKWKNKVIDSDCILCATIPFTRNLIEYTKGEEAADYLKLTSMLHWKPDTDQITVGQYLGIYNGLFGTNYDTSNAELLLDLLFKQASEICTKTEHAGLNLEDKVLLSIAIRLRAEMLITDKVRALKNDPSYWCQSNSQFGNLMKELSLLDSTAPELRTLEKVSITVSSNIHLNSFMYEPILDLSIEHLISLYGEILNLNPAVNTP